jgi:hypothetical protein
MLDTDGDGIINGTDLKRCVELVNIDSKFGIELQVLVDHYSATHLRIKTKPKPNDQIDLTSICNTKMLMIDPNKR